MSKAPLTREQQIGFEFTQELGRIVGQDFGVRSPEDLNDDARANLHVFGGVFLANAERWLKL